MLRSSVIFHTESSFAVRTYYHTLDNCTVYEIFKSRQVDKTLTSLKRKAVPVHLLLEERWIAWNLEASFLLNNRYTCKFVLQKQDFCRVTAFLHRLPVFRYLVV